MSDERPGPPASEPSWGARTLGFLSLAVAGILASNYLANRGRGGFAALAFLVSLVALSGAAVCSYRGLRSWRGFY